MKRICLLIVISLFLCGCKLYDEYKMPKNVNIKISKNDVFVYDKIKLKDIIKKSNVKINNKDEILHTKKIGKKEIIINYIYKNRKYKLKTYYTVKDNTKPVFLSANSNRYVKVNEDVNLCDNIVYADNYDKKVMCQIEGEYDLTNIGKYNLKYIIKDNSNNINEEAFTLNVVEDYPKDEENNNYEREKQDFSDMLKKYKTKDNSLGIDVSAWQGDIDFEKVKKAGCDFVIIRIGYNYKGKLNLDSYFEKNIEKARKAGLKIGVYLYTMAKTKKEARNQAHFIIKNLKNRKIDFPIAYDFEDWSNFNDYNLNLYELYELYEEFSNELKKSNYSSMIYGSKYYLENAWMNLEKNDVWLAHYTDETSYEKDYKFWQFSNTGRIDGISGNVDINIKK